MGNIKLVLLSFIMMITVLTFSNHSLNNSSTKIYRNTKLPTHRSTLMICFALIIINVFFTLRIALQIQVISVPSSVQLMQTCDIRVSTMSGCLCTTTQTTPALLSAKPRTWALWWSWRPRFCLNTPVEHCHCSSIIEGLISRRALYQLRSQWIGHLMIKICTC